MTTKDKVYFEMQGEYKYLGKNENIKEKEKKDLDKCENPDYFDNLDDFNEEMEFRTYIPFWDVLDIDRKPVENTIRLFLFRLIM